MNKEKSKKIYRTIMLIIVVALITFIITTAIMYKTFSGENKGTFLSSNYELNSKINNIKRILKKDYVGEIDESKLKDGAIKGYVDGLDDEYTEYFTQKEMEEFKAETEGNYVGIGIYMAKNSKDNNIVVVSHIEGSPAETAGIKTGDIIKKVDGKEYTADDFETISTYIKGKEGTKVNLEIERNGETLTFEVERKNIDLYPMKSEVLEGNIGYINIQSFDDGCAKEFQENYNELKEKKVTSLIIDLRNNGGGIVDEALDILDKLLDKDSVLMITKDKNEKEVVEKAKNKASIKIPVVVLVNENTASASEIFASALQDNNRAKIVGTKTYGKGVIQELLTLSDGSGIKITTEEYYTPNRNKINKVGITPNEEVNLPDNVAGKYNLERKDDTQLRRAVDMLK